MVSYYDLVVAIHSLEGFIDWALPDQLVFATVSALLRIASVYGEHREHCLQAIVKFVAHIVKMLQEGTCEWDRY